MTIGRVLVVDDENDIRRIVALSLSRVGKWAVDVVASGRDAVPAAIDNAPDVILLDVMMPGMNGPSTLAALRADPRTVNIPVIFLTAKTNRAELDEYRAMGVLGIIEKPFDPLTLPAQVARMVEVGAATP